MARNRKKRKKWPTRKVNRSGQRFANRNRRLDALRGLAILLMILDHMAFVGGVAIEPTSIRMVTRLSMPLFCVLMGYFLAHHSGFRWRRWRQLTLAASLMSSVYALAYGKLEILASLWISSLIAQLLGAWFAAFVAAVVLFPIDPSVGWFDYPLSVTLTGVAQGVLLQRFGLRAAGFSGGLIILASLLVPAPTTYVLWFLLPATLMVAWGSKYPDCSWQWLVWCGRYPLRIYITHYLILIAIDQWLL